MLNRIRKLFDQPDRALEELPRDDRLHLAAACLLVEAARTDSVISAEERARIKTMLRDHYELSEAESEDLVASAEQVTEGPAQWYAFTSKLKDAYDYEDRIRIIEMLWEVVYADGELHHLESSLLRRVGGLLYVSDRDRGEALRRVKSRLGLPLAPGVPDGGPSA